jgi:hypothetical protein
MPETPLNSPGVKLRFSDSLRRRLNLPVVVARLNTNIVLVSAPWTRVSR